MKKKIVIAISIVYLIFFIGAACIIFSIERATSKLDYLIKLHQVEILREELLLHIKKVQSNLSLEKTSRARSIDIVIDDVRYLENLSQKCFRCHHSVLVEKRLNGLVDEIEEYKNSFSRFLTMRANRDRVQIEWDTSFHISEKLMEEVNSMVHLAGTSLYAKTKSSLKKIAQTKIILYALVIIIPFIAAVLGFIFIREITKPVKVLLKATRQLTGGELDYKIEDLKDEFGEVAASFNEMADSLKQHMQKIQESETRYRMLFENAADAIFIMEAEGEKIGKIVAANQAAAKMHGYSIEELLNLSIQDLDTPDEAKEVPNRIQRILDGQWINEELTHRKKDGTVFPVEISAGLLELNNRKYVLAFDRNISERKRMETLLLQSKQEWEETFDTITDMITIHDKDFNIISANKAAQKILGLPWIKGIKAKCYQYYHGKDYPPQDCPSCECLFTGKPTAFETFEPHLDMHLETRAIPRFDNNNQLIGLIHVVRDITERKQVEGALQRAEQMKMVGEWATALVHEIKNPLAGIKASVEVLLDELNISEEEDRAYIYRAIDEIKRIELLLKSLLNFAKPPKPQLMTIDLNDLLDKTIAFSLKHPSILSDTAPQINVLRDFDDNLPETMADPMQLQQVFLNLLFNSIEAMPDGGTLGVKTFYDMENKTGQIEISDTGQGIDKDMIDKIFQPFFTTKRKGSGLGLAITRRLIEQHGGEIFVKSEPGKGTVFRIKLNVKKQLKEMAL